MIYATDMTIDTKGAHCATIATDRGKGTITVKSARTLTAAGNGSPLIYSTGTISLAGAKGTAATSQTMVIEGKEQTTVTDCTFTSNGTGGMDDLPVVLPRCGRLRSHRLDVLDDDHELNYHVDRGRTDDLRHQQGGRAVTPTPFRSTRLALAGRPSRSPVSQRICG